MAHSSRLADHPYAGESRTAVGAAASAFSLVATSVLPGRVRWSIPGLEGNAAAAASIQQRIAGLASVRVVRVSKATGRALVVFDEALDFSHMQSCVQAVVAEVFAGSGAPALGRVRRRRPIRTTAGKAVGLVAVGLGGISLGAVLSLGPLATGALAITAVSCTHVLQKAQVRFSGTIAELKDNRLRGEVAELIRPHRRSFLRAVGYNVASNFMGTARILLLGSAISAMVSIGPGAAGAPLFLGLQLPPVAVVLTASTLAAVWLRARFRQRSQIAWHQAVSEIQHSSRVHLFAHVQRMEPAYFQEYQSHEILRALSDDINQLDITGRAVWDLMDVAVYGTFLMAGIVIVGGSLATLALIPIPIIAGISAGLYPRLRFWHQRVRKEQARLEHALRDSINGVVTIKSFTAEARESERIKELSASYNSERRSSIEANAKLPVALEFVFQLATTSMFLYSSHSSAWKTFKIGSFVALNHCIGTLFFHLANLGPKLDDLERGVESLSHMSRVLGHTPPEDARQPVQTLGDVAGRDIDYRNVHFEYPGGRSVFKNLSLHFQGGKTTAVVGLTGSGKSTLIRLLLRYYQLQGGSIELGGVDLAHVERRKIREAVSVVDQNVFLFDRSVTENIGLNDPEVRAAEIQRVARLAQADQFIERLPAGYGEMLGEQGALLSGGERQRIAIARSLLKDAPVIVLDEATSSLDSNTEVSLQEQLLPLFSQRTVIIIAHRLSTIRNADHIIVLENGQCREQGTHEELMGGNGCYRSLWQSQFGEATSKPGGVSHASAG